jgi:hypothetical protein
MWITAPQLPPFPQSRLLLIQQVKELKSYKLGTSPKIKYGNLTPAEKAGIKFPFRNWLDVVKGGK